MVKKIAGLSLSDGDEFSLCFCKRVVFPDSGR